VEQMMAVRALNLAPGQLLVTLEMLRAVRARKLELAHKTSLFVLMASASALQSLSHAGTLANRVERNKTKVLRLKYSTSPGDPGPVPTRPSTDPWSLTTLHA
jgi:hypothetical protein